MQTQTDRTNDDNVWRLKLAELRIMGGLPALVLVTTLKTCTEFGHIGPFTVKGYSWVILFLAVAFLLIGQGFRSTFPLAIWVPWILLLATSLLFSDAFNALQRTALLVCPCLVGAGVACRPVRESSINAFLHGCRVLLGALLLTSLFRVDVLATWRLPDVTGLSGESMTAAMLATLFAAEFASGVRGAIWFWTVAFLLPVVAVVRGAIMATIVTLPVTLAPMRLGVRFSVIVVAALVGLAVFQSDRIQRKMFESGSGTIAELSLDNPNLHTSGRKLTWEIMMEQGRKKPWFGHGANANEVFLTATLGSRGQPHNDWVRLFFDYGYVGSTLFGLTMLVQVLHALAAARRATGTRRLFLYAGASGFVPFVVLMMTDNVVIYAGHFGNLHFALLGLGYSAQAPEAPPPEQYDV
jgi:O-antigen ligase